MPGLFSFEIKTLQDETFRINTLPMKSKANPHGMKTLCNFDRKYVLYAKV